MASCSVRSEEMRRDRINTKSKELFHRSASSLAFVPLFHSSSWSEVTLLVPLILLLPKWMQSCGDPCGLCEFPFVLLLQDFD